MFCRGTVSSHLKSFIFQNKEEKYSDVALGPPLRSLEPQFMCPEFFHLCHFIPSHSNHMKEMIAPILQGGKTGGVFTFVPSALQGLHGYKCAPEMGPGDPAEVSVWSQHQKSATRIVQPQSLPSTGPCAHGLPPWADDLSSILGDRCPSALAVLPLWVTTQQSLPGLCCGFSRCLRGAGRRCGPVLPGAQ